MLGNLCATNHNVRIIIQHFDQFDRLLHQCDTGAINNYAECAIQQSTASGDYWAWSATITVSGTNYSGYCSVDYSQTVCWETQD
jgi:hypothetical protein